MVQTGQVTAFSLDRFSIFMFIVLQNRWFDWLLRSLILKPSDAGEFLQCKQFYLLFASESKSWLYEIWRKCDWIDGFRFSNSSISVSWGLESSIKIAMENIILRKEIVWQNFSFYPCIKILSVRNCQMCYHLWCIYVTELMFLPSIGLISPMKASVETTTLLKWVFGWKWLIYLVRWFRIVIPQVFQIVQFFLVHGEFQTIFHCSYKLFPP